MDNSPLEKLPPELRVMIYEFALLKACPIEILWYKQYEKDLTIRKWTAPSILQVCRQIRIEAGPVYFGANTFNCDTADCEKGRAYSPHNMAIAEWLEVIDETQRNMLRVIRVDDLTYAPEEVKGRVQNFKEEMNRFGLNVDQAEVFVELCEADRPALRSYVYVSE